MGNGPKACISRKYAFEHVLFQRSVPFQSYNVTVNMGSNFENNLVLKLLNAFLHFECNSGSTSR